MSDQVGDAIANVTLGQAEMLGRLDQAVRAVVAIVIPDPEFAAGGLLGSGIAMLIEHAGVDEAQVHAMVTHWFAHNGDFRAHLARLSMHVVPPSDPEYDGP